MKTDLKALSETYDLFPVGLLVKTEVLLALAALEREFDALAAYTGAKLRMTRVQFADRDVPLLMDDIQSRVDQLNASKRQIGEAALRGVGLDPVTQDFAIDEDSGEVYRLVRRIPA